MYNKNKLGSVHNQSKKVNTSAIYNLFHDYFYLDYILVYII
jgi:hypothetical protein